MTIRIKILILPFLAPLISAGQSSSTLIGARSNGLAYASACVADEWSLFNNVAGIAEAKGASANFTYDVNPNFSAFNRMAAVLTVPSKFVMSAVGVYRFGDDLYNEHLISLGVANTFGIASLGVKANYIQYYADGAGAKGFLTISAGGIARLTPHFSIGSYITNISPPALSSIEKESIPTILSLALAFKPTDKLFLTTEIEKDLELDPKWKTGFEYAFHKKVIVRTGYVLKPQTAFFGLGLRPRKFQLDYCVQVLNKSGLAHQASVGYAFKSKSK
jgi:hypothetical protein